MLALLNSTRLARLLFLAARRVGRLRMLGGPGSGFFGHAGRPGYVGGSTTEGAVDASRGGGSSVSSGKAWKNPAPKLASELSGVTPATPIRTFTVYHVTRVENVNPILEKGFDLTKIQAQWSNDYAISFSRGTAKGAANYFSKKGQPLDTSKYALLEAKVRGRFGDVAEMNIHTFGGGASEYTRQVIASGHDGQDVGKTLYVHNPRAILSIRQIAIPAGQKGLSARILGGPGSGNFGHAGRPGEVGGSAPIGGSTEAKTRDRVKLNLNKNGYDEHGNPGPRIARKGGSLWLYRSTGGYDLNAALRSGNMRGTKSMQKMRYDLDHAMKPLGENAVLMRDYSEDWNFTIGVTHEEKGYTSTSYELGTFAKGKTVEIEVPARAPVIRIGDYYKDDSEKEIILGRGSKFEVIGPNRLRWVSSATQPNLKTLGGPGSGHFGHAGRPGEVGGSSPGDGTYTPRRESSYYGEPVGGISLDAHRFITDWQDSPTAVPSRNVIEELKKYRPTHKVKLYRATGKSNAPFRAWTYSRNIAEGFVEEGEKVITRTWYPDEILLDFTKLPEAYKKDLDLHGMGTELQEVITIYKTKHRALGGPGSGHFGHAGRPGEVGGSAEADFPVGLTKIGSARGTNPGGVYRDQTGKQWYVKHYRSADQAANEHVANAIYRAVGVPVPTSALSHDGKQIALRWEDSRGTLGEVGVTKDTANRILDGFVADVFVQNWDAVGTGHDNVIIKQSGTPLRVDQGGSLLFRAQGSPKPESTLDKIDEWETLRTRNSYYNAVFTAAGIKDADALKHRAMAQIARVIEARPQGGWETLVRKVAPTATETFKTRVGQMLEARQAALERKRAELVARLTAAEMRTLYDPDQPRAPKGDPQGGQWVPEGGGSGGSAAPATDGKKKAPKAPPVPLESKQKAYDEVKKGGTFKATAEKYGMTHGQLAGYVWKTDQKKAEIAKKLAETTAPVAPVAPAPVAPVPAPKQTWSDLTTTEKMELALHVEKMVWKEKTHGPKKGEYAWFDKTGQQVSAPFPSKNAHREALDTINYGKGIEVPEVNKVGWSAPTTSPAPTTPIGWPIKDSVERKLGNTYPSVVEKNFAEWRNKLSHDEKSTITGYTGTNYEEVNNFLRKGTVGHHSQDQFYKKQAKEISDALARAPSPPPPDLIWRGTNSDTVAKLVANVKSGSVIKLDGFQSSTIKPKFAYDWGEKTIFEIKPTKGAYVRPISHHPHEWEYLLPHGSNYTVRGITYVKFEGLSKKVRVIQLEQHP